MGWINNERYRTIFEEIMLNNSKFICAYLPAYGLIKINSIIVKILNHEGYFNSIKDSINVEYIIEKLYIDGYRGEELGEKEIYDILRKTD